MTHNADLRVLVTGSTGFIGRHLMPQLFSLYPSVTAWNGDIQTIADCPEKADVVVHLAGSTRHELFTESKHTGFEVNVLGTQAVLEYCRKTGARLLFASTSAVYPSSKTDIPCSEISPIGPQTPYGLSKWLAEELCKQYAVGFGVPATILRIFNPYGIGLQSSFLIPNAIASAMEGKTVLLRMPNAIRDFVYIDDLVAAFLKVLDYASEGCEIFNIGTGCGMRIHEVLEKVALVWGRPLKMEMVQPHPGELAYSVADCQKAKKVLGWEPQFSLEKGLEAIKKEYGIH